MTDSKTATELVKKLVFFDLRKLEYEADKPGSDMTIGEYERKEAELIGECVQAIAATLVSSTLTAEQVEDVVYRNVKFYEGGDVDVQSIAHELNAMLESGECEFVIEDNMNETEGMGDVWFRCTSCDTCFDYYADDWLMKMNYCPHCGKAVKR